MRTKRCPNCKQTKAVEHFGRDRTSKDGRQRLCRACLRIVRADPEFGLKRL